MTSSNSIITKDQIEQIKDHILSYPVDWDQNEEGGFILKDRSVQAIENIQPKNKVWKQDGVIFHHKTFNPDYSLISKADTLYHSHPIPMKDGDFLSNQDILWADFHKKNIIMYHPYMDKLELYNPKYSDVVRQLERTSDPKNFVDKPLKPYQIPKNNIKRFNKAKEHAEKSGELSDKKYFFLSNQDQLINEYEHSKSKKSKETNPPTEKAVKDKSINSPKKENRFSLLRNIGKMFDRTYSKQVEKYGNNPVKSSKSTNHQSSNLNEFKYQQKNSLIDPIKFVNDKHSHQIGEINRDLFDFSVDSHYQKKQGEVNDLIYDEIANPAIDIEDEDYELISLPKGQKVVFFCGIGDYEARIAHQQQQYKKLQQQHLKNIASVNYRYSEKKEAIVKELINLKMSNNQIDSDTLKMFGEINNRKAEYRDIIEGKKSSKNSDSFNSNPNKLRRLM